MRRRDFAVLANALAAGWPLIGHWQQPAKLYRIGVLALLAGALVIASVAPLSFMRPPAISPKQTGSN